MFLSKCFFCCCFAFRILVFIFSALNGDRNFFIVGITLFICLPKNLCAGDVPVDFDGALLNSSMARQELLFLL